LEDSGYIDLYFGDGSHFGLASNVLYARQTKENPILLPSAKGRFLNVAGLTTRKNKLFYEVHETAFNAGKAVRFMDGFVAQTVKRTVVIPDNSPVRKSNKFIDKTHKWKDRDVSVFFLPSHSPELNPVEILWRRIRYDWIPFDACFCFQNLKERLSYVLAYFGAKYDILL
jgi:hypothetical protein